MYKINDKEILIYDYITDGITARAVIDEFYKKSTYPAVLRINSYGGDVFEAIALYNWLKPCNVTVYVDGICASAASIIAMAGHVVMPRNTMMMIHNPIGYVYGDSEEMKKESEILDKIRENIASIYSEKTGQELSKIIELMQAESWMNGGEAKALGFADEVTGPIENKALRTYEDGVKAERERIRDLDELMSPGREEIISAAKYKTFRNASDIAVELVKQKPDMAGAVYAQTPGNIDAGDKVAEIINRMRGYK